MKSTKKKKTIPLKVLLLSAFLAFSALLIVALWLAQTVFLDESYQAVKTVQVKRCAASVCDHLEDDALNDLVSDIEEQNSMTVSIYTVEKGVLTTVYRTQNRAGMDSKVDQSKIHEYYQNTKDAGGSFSVITARGMQPSFDQKKFKGNDASTDESKNENENDGFPKMDDKNGTPPFGDENFKRGPDLEKESVSSLAYSQIAQTESNTYFVILESDITPVSSVVETLRIQLIILTAVLAVISVAAALLVARGIAKPLSDTNEEAKKLARLDYDVHFSDGRYREINELNETLSFSASELEKVDDLRKELIANISHDLRTPLTMITGYAEVMRDLPGEATGENLQIIIDESNHLNALVTDLLDISKLESGTAEIHMAPFSLTRSIEGIFSRYTKLIEAEGFDLRFEHDQEVFVNADEMRITQVVYNLINNAINYSGEDKTVIVRQTVSGENVKIEVIDHGEGIDEEQLPYIWDRYYRVDREHKQAKVGSGLGLSIVKNILKAHDASYGVESKTGEGATFWFSMKKIDTDAADPNDGAVM